MIGSHASWNLVLVVLMGGSLLTAGAVSEAQPAQDRVDRFLAMVLKETSLDRIREAFEGEHFSEAEIRRIEAEVGKGVYRRKLDQLRPQLPPVKLDSMEVTRKAASRAATIRAPAMSSVPPKAAGAAAAAAAGRKPIRKPPSAPTISDAEYRAIVGPPGEGTGASISSVSPTTVRPGQVLAVSGAGFGRGRGSVEILLDRHVYVCDLGSWSDGAIRAVVPDYMDTVIAGRSREARLWVKPAGESLGPTASIRVEPDPAATAPEIVSLGSDEAEPGRDLAVWGRNFGRTRGTAWCDFGGTRLDLVVLSWSDTDVRVRVAGDAAGIPGVSGTLTVRTAAGRQAGRPITFRPVLEEIDISWPLQSEGTWSCRRGGEFFERGRDSPLQRGWTVVSFRLEHVAGRGDYDYVSAPRAGTSDLYHVVHLATDPFSDLCVISRITVRGPRGTAPFR